jgi:hypothetical protein
MYHTTLTWSHATPDFQYETFNRNHAIRFADLFDQDLFVRDRT